MGGHHMFDNVFVDSEAFKAFVKTGTWPDKTMLVIEVRSSAGKGSINRKAITRAPLWASRRRKRRSALSGQVGILWLWRRKTAKMIPTRQLL